MQAEYPDRLCDIEPYDPKKLEAHLEAGATEIRVFRLKKGMIINIEGISYKVIAIRENGKATIKPK